MESMVNHRGYWPPLGVLTGTVALGIFALALLGTAVGAASTGLTEQTKLTPSDSSSFNSFGISVSISGETAAFGATGDDDGGPFSGSAPPLSLEEQRTFS